MAFFQSSVSVFMLLVATNFAIYAQSLDTTQIDWSRYDYMPGQQLLFYDNFTADREGEAPEAWSIAEGGEVKAENFQNKLWLQARKESTASPKDLVLPAQFTLEMDFYVFAEGYSGRYRVDLVAKNPEEWASLTLEPLAVFFSMSNGLTSEKAVELRTGIHHLDLQVDGAGFKCYVDKHPVITIPKSGSFAAVKIELFMPGPGDETGDDHCRVTDFFVAQGPASLQNQLNASGKIVAYGIYFDAGKATLRPESTPTLKQFAELMQADASLSFSIECHDNERPEQSDNVKLSQGRAEALKDFLVETYRIPSNRLDTRGWGETRPLGEPGTVDGRKMNQRVEFIRK